MRRVAARGRARAARRAARRLRRDDGRARADRRGHAGPSPGDGARQARPDGAVRIAVVTHGPASSKFWAIIRNGVDAAARQLDVLVDYQSPDVYSVERMSELIDQAVASKPDGLVVSIPEAGPGAGDPARGARRDPGRLDQLRQRRLPPLRRARPRRPARGPRGPGGRAAARRRRRAARAVRQPADRQPGPRRALPRAGAGDARGRRAARACSASTTRAPRRRSRIADAVRSGRIDGVLALNSTSGLEAAKAARRVQGDPRAEGRHLRPRPRRAARGARPPDAFAVDQQAYLQGYLPIEMLALRARYGIFPAQGDVIADRARTSSRAPTPRRRSS